MFQETANHCKQCIKSATTAAPFLQRDPSLKRKIDTSSFNFLHQFLFIYDVLVENSGNR